MRQCHLIAFGFDDVCFICCCHSNPIGVPSSSFGPSLFNTDLENSLWSEDTQTPSSIIILGIVADNLASCFSAFRFAFCVFSNRITNSWFLNILNSWLMIPVFAFACLDLNLHWLQIDCDVMLSNVDSGRFL